jgi:hypothetical protein
MLKNGIRLQSETSLQLWKTQTTGASTGHVVILKITKILAQESLGYCESKHLKPWFDDECSELVDRRKKAKLQWLQDPSEANEDNLSDVQWEASRHFRNKKREYLKEKINELESPVGIRTSETCIGA